MIRQMLQRNGAWCFSMSHTFIVIIKSTVAICLIQIAKQHDNPNKKVSVSSSLLLSLVHAPQSVHQVAADAKSADTSVWYFNPKKKGLHTGDYHKVFNRRNFKMWITEYLIPALDKLQEKCMIIMDRASDSYYVSSSFSRRCTWQRQALDQAGLCQLLCGA
jgi:hypothetical protein